MSRIYQTVKSCIYKGPTSEQVEVVTDINDLKESDAPDHSCNKKTDEVLEHSNQPGMIWRVSSGLYSTAAGAVSMGVGGVRWVAEKGYDMGHTVVSRVPVPPIPKLRRKDKNE